MSREERADDFPPDLVSDDEAIDLVIDAVVLGSKQLRRLSKKILKAQQRLQHLKTCTYECTGGYHHTWVQFDDDPNRSYGYWPSASSPLGSIGIGRGVLRSNDSPSDICRPGPAVCRDSTSEENALIEEELKQSVAPAYVFGMSDCRQVPAFVNQRLDELHGTRSAWDTFWDVFFDLL